VDEVSDDRPLAIPASPRLWKTPPLRFSTLPSKGSAFVSRKFMTDSACTDDSSGQLYFINKPLNELDSVSYVTLVRVENLSDPCAFIPIGSGIGLLAGFVIGFLADSGCDPNPFFSVCGAQKFIYSGLGFAMGLGIDAAKYGKCIRTRFSLENLKIYPCFEAHRLGAPKISP
jgi:hypothetical protein